MIPQGVLEPASTDWWEPIVSMSSQLQVQWLYQSGPTEPRPFKQIKQLLCQMEESLEKVRIAGRGGDYTDLCSFSSLSRL